MTPGNAKVTITWQAPSSWGTWPAVGYTIEWKTTSGGTIWSTVHTNAVDYFPTTSETSFDFTGQQDDASAGVSTAVANGTAYDLRINANSQQSGTDGTDPSHYQNSSWVTFSSQVPGRPAKTTGLSVTAGAGKLDLSWTAPANNGSAITGYDVHYKTSSAADQTGTGSDPTTGWVAASHSGTTASGSIPSLTNGTAYDVRVRAKNTHGAGEWSDAQSGTPQAATPTTLTLSVPAATSLSEAAGSRTATVTATLDNAAGSGGVTVNISSASGATATGGGVDYSLASTITISSGNTTGTATLTVIDDNLMEGTESIALNASSTSPSLTAQTLYTNISDNDSATFSFSSATYSVAEATNDKTLTLTVNVAGTLGTAVNGLGVTTTDGTATRGTDYQTPGSTASFDIDFSAGDSSKDVAITILGDTTSETDESFTVALEIPNETTLPISIGTPGTTTVTITEESSNANLSGLTASSSTSVGGTYSALDIGTFSASTTSYTATVPNATTHAKLTPTVEDTGKATVTVGGTDVPSGSASDPIALNQGVNAITVRVTAEDSTTKDYTVTITREAAPETPTVRLSASPNPVDEGNSVTVTARLSAALANPVTIPLALTDDTAEPEDHGTLSSITIAANDTTGTGAITTNQDTDTDDETFTVALDNLPASVAAGTPSSVQVRIRDDDGGGGPTDPPDPPDPPDPSATPSVRLSAAPNPVHEGSSVTVTARLSSALTRTVTIPLRLTAGSAERGDYGRLDSITIASGQTSGTGTISTNADADADDETFTVALRNLPSSVTAGRPRSVEITITEAVPTPALPLGGALLLGLLLAWRGAVRVRRRGV